MITQEQLREAYQRMIAAHQDLQIYLRSSAQDRTEFRRLTARAQTATDEYYILLNKYLEHRYALLPFGDERSA